jgi:hypothetical protein
MRPNRVLVWGCALAALLVGRPAQAGWNNVFQVCCQSCGNQSTIAMASPVDSCAPPCPQQTCTTRYIQRSYYQPVTTYRTSYYLEPVTSYKTSYYYEPVTTYRYSCSYDPCTCSYQQVTTPCTSYRLRSQCCPVTSYLQRCSLTPVTSYQQVNYYEPQTTCCTTTTGAPVYGQAPAVQAPAVQGPPLANPPKVEENRQPGLTPSQGAPNVSEFKEPPPANPNKFNRNAPAQSDPNFYGQPQIGTPVPTTPSTPTKEPVVRPDRIASLLGESMLRGQVVSNDRPQAGARLLFISKDEQHTQKEMTSDASGRFEVSLPSGNWLVYTHGSDGRPIYQQKIEVRDRESHLVKLVNR